MSVLRRPNLLRTAPAAGAKVTLPSPGDAVLPRPPLFDRLCAQPAAWWIGAPAATGKTVLAASALRARGAGVLWYQVDSADADPAACFHYLGQALQQLPGAARRASLPTPGRETGSELGDFSRAWFRALFQHLSPGATVVFDDWQRLPAEHPLQALLATLVDERPPAVGLWLLSREAPPPSLHEARLSGRLHTLALRELALTADEVHALMMQRAPAAAAAGPDHHRALAERWHRWCEGWVGALVFAWATGRDAPDTPPAGVPAPQPADLEPVFGALSAELVDRAEAPLRRFMLDTAWAPWFGLALASRLSPGSDSAACVARLVQRQLLLPLAGRADPAWRYHPLLREVLLERNRAEAADPARATRAAECLDESGQPEAAAEWLIDARAWPALAALLLRQAPLLLEQGRYTTLAAWAGALPDAERTPWIDAWWASAALARNARDGLRLFERAYAGFWAAGDAAGLYRAWCGVIESATFACDDYRVLQAWLARLRELRARHRYPSLRVRAEVLVHAFAAGFLVHPRPPEFDGWQRSVQRLFRFIPRRAERAAIGALIGLHHSANGGMAALGAHLHALRPLLDDAAVPPFYRLVGGVPEVIHHWIGGDVAQALARITGYEALARDTGAHAIDTQYAFQAAYALTLQGDGVAAASRLAGVAPLLPRLGRIDSAQHAFLSGWLAALEGRGAEATRLLQEAVEDAQTRHFVFFETICRGLLGELLAQDGQSAAAERESALALQRAQELGSVTARVPCLLQRAAVAQACGRDRSLWQAWLQEGLALARRHGHWAWGGLMPQGLARLAAFALEAGIEPDFVRELVRRHRLQPPPDAGAAWPWPLVLRGFGELQIVLRGVPLERAGLKAAQRPLALLRGLLANWPRPLPVAQALAWIWPDAEAAAGADPRKAFDVALLRARRLLGDDSLLRLEGGVLQLDDKRVWTDLAAMARLADAFGSEAAPAPAAARALALEWLALARGPLLAEDNEPWLAPARERWRRRTADTAERLAGALLAAQGASAEPGAATARELLDRGFALDPASEPLARRLAALLAGTGDRHEALRVLRLCQSSRDLAGEPALSADTVRLSRRIADGR